MAKNRSKQYLELTKLVDTKKNYSYNEGVELIKKINKAKFDASIDLAIKLNLDTNKADQQLKGMISLPHYYGKAIKIIAITDLINKQEEIALEIKVGQMDLINEIKKGWLDFDLIITTPKYMPFIAKLGKILGPKGLMPNPKLGTVTNDIKKTISDFKKGKYQYKTDLYGNIHMKFGKFLHPQMILLKI